MASEGKISRSARRGGMLDLAKFDLAKSPPARSNHATGKEGTDITKQGSKEEGNEGPGFGEMALHRGAGKILSMAGGPYEDLMDLLPMEGHMGAKTTTEEATGRPQRGNQYAIEKG